MKKLTFNQWIGCGEKYGIRKRWDLEPEWPILQEEENKILDDIKELLSTILYEEISVSGINVPITPNLPPYVVYLLLNNAYEHGDIQLIRTYINTADTASMIGAGIGFVAVALAQQTQKPLLAVDANPDLRKNIELCAKANTVTISFLHGAISSEPAGSEISFTLAKEFWSSSLDPNTHLADRVIKVKAISIREIVKKAKANTLFIDVEGAETFMFKQPIPKTVTKLFVEIHRPNIGTMAWAEVMNDIFRQGFQLKDSKGLTTFWSR